MTMKWCLRIIICIGALLTISSVECSKALNDVEIFFLNFNKQNLELNKKVSLLAWEAMNDPSNTDLQLKLEEIAGEKMKFINRMCDHMLSIKNKLDSNQHRIYSLICIGPKFESEFEQGKLLEISSMIQYIYTNTKICIPETMDICNDANKLWNFTYVQGVHGLKQFSHRNDDEINLLDVNENVKEELKLKCYSGEPQLEKIMDDDFSKVSTATCCKDQKSSIDYWIWEAWRNAIGPNIRELYPQLINLSNRGAQKGGFSNIGDLWQKEMEIDNVEELMLNLLNEIQPFYNMLHAFVKSILEKRFAFESKFNMPAHLLGWNANWHHLLEDYIELDGWRVDKILAARQWSSHDTVKRIEDFFTSLGLSRLSHEFWEKSYIEDTADSSCHGTAANMYSGNDFRVVVCGYKRLYDLYVITHEIGHIQQYMLTQNKPAPFQTGNSVIQETIGDSIFLALMTPMHLNRLKLIDDASLFPSPENNFDLHQLMHMAMLKVPEVPFAFVFETFRFNLFAERIDMEHSNDYFWDLTRKFQRIEPPNESINRHQLFDVAAKFHFAANVPYARYFFANILQYQVYRGLCEATLYGRVKGNQTLNMPLHKCDIYGSRRAGKLLKKSLRNGSEWTFKKTLKSLTGSEEISTSAMLEYYQPLIDWLKKYLTSNNIEY